MPFRSIVASPEDVARLSAHLETAWQQIMADAPVDPLAIPAARERLGHIIVMIWNVDPDGDLATRAADQFLTSPAAKVAESDEALG